MNFIRTIRWVLALGALVYLVCDSDQFAAVTNDNARAEGLIHQANNIVPMWRDGFPAEYVPSFKPSMARGYLDGVLASRADPQLKEEARKVLADLDRRPHYIDFAEHGDEFLPRLAAYQATVAADPAGTIPALPPGGKFLVLAKRPSGGGTNRDPSELYFDAELIEACGERAATDPAEVAAVVVAESSRQIIGRYQMNFLDGRYRLEIVDPEQAAEGGLAGSLRPNIVGPAFRETCTLTTHAYPSGRPIAREEIVADDPARVDYNAGGPGSAAKQVRDRLAPYIRGLVASHP